MLISRSYKCGDFSKYLYYIIEIAEQNSIECIMFPGWSFDNRKNPIIDHGKLFRNGSSLKVILFELANLETEEEQEVQLWVREIKTPIKFYRRFAASSASLKSKLEFVNEIESRVYHKYMVMICGEINALTWKRKEKLIIDPFGIKKKIRNFDISIVINNAHYFFKRYEIAYKQSDLSKEIGLVLCCWNHSYRQREGKIPWRAYLYGQKITDSIMELPIQFTDRPDIRIGILKPRPN